MSGDGTRAFSDERHASTYLHAVRDHWLLIVAIVAVCVGVAVAYSATATKRYEASADLLVTPIASTDDTYVGISSLLRETDQGRAVLTASSLLRSPVVVEGVDRRLGLGWNRRKLLDAVSISPVGQSNIVTITATSSDPGRSAAIANAFANELVDQRSRLFQQQLRTVIAQLRGELKAIPAPQQSFGQAAAIASRLGSLTPLVGQSDPTLQVASPAVPPYAASWPRPVLSVVVAFVAGLLLALGLAVGLEVATPRLGREDELLTRHRLPVLTRVPRMSKSAIRGYLRGDEPLPGDVREAYRTLRASLAAAGRGDLPGTILVTSAIPGEGKTMTAVNLANTIASSGLRVVLVDGDLRRPMIATMFGLPVGRSSISDVLLGRVPLADALVPAPGARDALRLLLANPDHGHLVDVVQPSRMEDLMAELRFEADVVVFDSAPLTEVADALTLATEADAVVVAVRLGRTRRDKLAELRRMLARAGATPVGFVVTTARRSRGHGYYYGGEREPTERDGVAPAIRAAYVGEPDEV